MTTTEHSQAYCGSKHTARRTLSLLTALGLLMSGPAPSAARVANPFATDGQPATNETTDTTDGPARVRRLTFQYTAHDGRTSVVYVALPAWYRPDRNPTIPLVIAPHGRNATAKSMLARFGNLPAIGAFVLVSPETQGRRTELYPWGYRRTIDDIARMPELLADALPWLRIDPTRIYAFGTSMGGQEVLLLAALHPHLLAGVAAFDSTVDFGLQYRNFAKIEDGRKLQRLARAEVGGTPTTAPTAYSERSPMTYTRELAHSGVRFQIWWTPRDEVVIQPGRQSRALVVSLTAMNPEIALDAFTGRWQHAKSMRADHVLPMALARFGLLPKEFGKAPIRFHVAEVAAAQ